MPTTSPLKRPSGGRLRRLLASLRPPARAGGPLPVQTGFPTSLADIVVKNHGRLRNPRRRHRAAVPPPTAAAAEPAPVAQSQERRELSVPRLDAAAPVTVTARRGPGKGAGGFSIRPGILAAGGAVALALLVVWSKQLVVASTLASVALSWIESVRIVRDRRRETEEEMDSPVGEAAESPRPSCGDSDSDNGDADSGDVGREDSSSSSSVKRKQRQRSLRKLLASKLRNGRKTPPATDCRHAGELERPETPRSEPAEVTPTPLTPEANVDDDRWHHRRRGALPLPALVPIILAGLVAGKIPAMALAVLCAAFSSSVERAPTGQQQASR